MKDHKDLVVWRKSIDFAGEIYSITKKFPKEEQFGLVTQLRRAVVSISANIAEGASRKSRKEYLHFLYIARASASELDTLLEISIRTSMLKNEIISNAKKNNLVLIKMLTALIKRLSKLQTGSHI